MLAAGACLVDPLVDPDGPDAGLAGHGVDQRHLAAVGAELPGLHHVEALVHRVELRHGHTQSWARSRYLQ